MSRPCARPTVAVLALVALALGALPSAPPGALAQAWGPAIVVTDAAGDPSLGVPNSPAPAPASDGIDVLEASLFGETGEAFLLRIKLKDIPAEGAIPSSASSGVAGAVCWSWSGTLFAARVTWVINTVPVITGMKVGVVEGECDPAGQLVFASGKSKDRVPVHLDPLANTVTFAIKRTFMAELAKAAAPPKAGEQLKDFKAFVTDVRRTRFDAAPNTGVAAEALTLASQTANLDLRAFPDANTFAQIACLNRPDLPTYAIEAGGKRGIPVVLESPARSPRPTDLRVESLSGPDWHPKMMPKVTLPAATDGGPGNLTVNVIVDTPQGTKHKECATIRVQALDPADPNALGETSVNVVAVSPPTTTQNKLYLHTGPLAANTCSNSEMWLNTLQDDPDDANKEVLMIYCRDTSPVSNAAATITPRIDVNPSHDLVLNTSAAGAKATATVRLRSDGVATNARIEVSVVTGLTTPTSIGQGGKVGL